MKHLKTFVQINEELNIASRDDFHGAFNENIIGDIARLNPDRKENDEKFSELIDDVIEDFNNNGKDLKKVHISIDDNEISFSKIEVGKSYTLSYVFGKYHPVKRNLFYANKEDWDRRIKIVKIPFWLTIKKNYLEKAFGTKRIGLGFCRVEDEIAIPNYGRNPNIGKYAVHVPKKVEYEVSADMANYLFNFFVEEYDKQYPELKGIRNKNSNDILDIQSGVSPVVKYITVKSKDGEPLAWPLRKNENEKKIKQKLSNMSLAEYEKYLKQRQDEIYYYSNKKSKEKEEQIKSKFGELISNLDIEIEEDWEKIRVLGDYGVKIVLATRQEDVDINKLPIPEEFDGYNLKDKNMSSSFDGEKKWITIIYEK